MPRDVDAPRDPDLLVLLHVVEEALQRAKAPRPAEQPAVHADAQHLRPVLAGRVALVVEHVEGILSLLHEKNNRLVWGALIALSTIAELKSAAIGRHAEEIMRIMESGSVITVDNGVKTLAGVASKEPRLRKELVAWLFDHLRTCRPKDVPQHSEKTLVAVDRQARAEFIKILNARLSDLSPSQAKRVKKVISSAGT